MTYIVSSGALNSTHSLTQLTKHFYHRTATQINSKNYTVYSATEQIETIITAVQHIYNQSLTK